MNNNQIFFSHTWRPDSLGRDNHERVLNIANILKNKGWKIWIDEENIVNNIDASIAEGIEKSDIILIFLTETYFKKVNESAKNPRMRDNCLKEWTYANALNKLMIPIVFEPSLLNIVNWPQGIISMHFGSTFYLDCIYDDLNKCANIIHNYLIKIKDCSEKKINEDKKIYKNLFNNNKFIITYLKKLLFSLSNMKKNKYKNQINNKYIKNNCVNENDSLQQLCISERSSRDSDLTQSESSEYISNLSNNFININKDNNNINKDSNNNNNNKDINNLKIVNLYSKPIRKAPILQ